MTRRRLKKGQHLAPKISDEQTEMIGDVIANWSHLEWALDRLIWYFLKLDAENGRIVTATMDTRPKIRMLRELVDLHVRRPIPFRKAIIEVLDTIETLAGDRNFIAHGLWGTLIPDNVPMATSLRIKAERGHVTSEAFPHERMLRIIETIREFGGLLNKLPSELVASRKRYESRLRRLKTSRKPTPGGPKP